MSQYYALENKKAVPCDVLTWAGRFADNQSRRVAQTQIGEAKISTVFLGVDHNWDDEGPPLLFETMVFGGPMDQEVDLCETWDQATAMHDAMCDRVLQAPAAAEIGKATP